MAKKQANNRKPQAAATTAEQAPMTLKDMLGEAALAKLKQAERDLKNEVERAAQEEQEARRREKEEREKNKSFGELLDEYDKKSGGKFS
ncbi:DUF3886 domain-containing protein [Brevibacillus fluminis]|uniref:DUF3886 domain-containing protein n=1 Tax=Brevibacillus fluminis TaxID=511487 RepID=UPI003F8A1BAD